MAPSEKKKKKNYEVIPSLLLSCFSEELIRGTREYMVAREARAAKTSVAESKKVKAEKAAVEKQLKAAEAALANYSPQSCEVLVSFLHPRKT
jgi:hypothetical protein